MSTGIVHVETAVALGIDASSFDEIAVHRELSDEVLAAIGQLETDAVCTPFQSSGWLRHMSGSRLDQAHCLIVVCTSKGAPVLVLPFALDISGTTRRISWLFQNLADYGGPVGCPKALASLTPTAIDKILRFAAQCAGGVDVAVLEKQKAFYGEVPNPFVNETSIRYHVAAHATRLKPDWAAYYEAKRSARTRSRLKSKFNALTKLGEVGIRFSDDPAEAERLVRLGLDMKSRQLSQRGHSNPFASHVITDRLARTFARDCTSATWVVSLSLNGKPLAISFGFRDKKSWLLYQIAMEPGAYVANSPGTQLITFILGHCCAQDVKIFDFSLGDEDYKMEWCEATERLFTTFIPLTGRGQLTAAPLRMAAHGRLLAASNPWIYERAKILKGKYKTKNTLAALNLADQLQVEILSPQDMQDIESEWLALSENALEDNAYYAPHYANALLATVAAHQHVQFIAVRLHRKLIGLLPVEKSIGQGQAWQTQYNYSSTPLLSAAHPELAADGLLEGLSRLRAAQWHIPTVNMDGPAMKAICAALARRGAPYTFTNHFARASLEREAGFESHLTRHVNKDLRKSLARRKRRLEELGQLTHEHAEQGARLAHAVNEFLEMESSGWKGKRGTALVKNNASARFANLAFNAEKQGVVRADVLRLDGHALAAVLTVISGETGFTVKTAYDESYGKFSPAKLLELEILRDFYAGNWAKRLDSGTNGAHVIDEFWPGRVRVANLMFSLARHGAEARLHVAAARMHAMQGVKNSVKKLLNRN